MKVLPIICISEMKVYKQQMKQMAEQIKFENSVQSALNVWQSELLPNWETV